jgi:serine/threonine protein kinase
MFTKAYGEACVVAAFEGTGLLASMLRSYPYRYDHAQTVDDPNGPDIQPSNILVMIRDKQAVHRRLQEYGAKSTADSSPNTDTYSLVHSEPLIEEDDLYDDQVSVKIVDFGVGISSSLIIPNASAAWTDHKFSETIQPIGLRAPEVVLGLNWGTPVDIWSAASLVSLPAFRFAI